MMTLLLLAVAPQIVVDGDPAFLGGDGKLSKKAIAAVESGLDWLVDHQSDGGFWDCDDFPMQDRQHSAAPSDGAGSVVADVGVTGLAVLAILGAPELNMNPRWVSSAKRGLEWLLSVQQEAGEQAGLFGGYLGMLTSYNHSIATLALADGIQRGVVDSTQSTEALNAAVQVIIRSRIEDAGWGYSVPGDGPLSGSKDPNAAITHWCLLALVAARDLGVEVPSEVFSEACAMLLLWTDLESGYSGYSEGAGFVAARVRSTIDRFPPRHAPALVAGSLLSHLASADREETKTVRGHEEAKLLRKQAKVLSEHLPSDYPEAYEPYYWFFGALATHQMSRKGSGKWQKALEKKILPLQRDDGNFAGSWDPAGPWSEDTGRVGDTALVILALEAPIQFQKALR